MCMGVSCYDVLAMLFDEFISIQENEYHKRVVINEELNESLKEICAGIDNLAEDCDVISYGTEIDEETGEITISADCGEIIIEDKEHPFYKTLEMAKTVWFGKGEEEESVLIKLTFGSIFMEV